MCAYVKRNGTGKFPPKRKHKFICILVNMFIVDIQRIHTILGVLLFILKVRKGQSVVNLSKNGVSSWKC